MQAPLSVCICPNQGSLHLVRTSSPSQQLSLIAQSTIPCTTLRRQKIQNGTYPNPVNHQTTLINGMDVRFDIAFRATTQVRISITLPHHSSLSISITYYSYGMAKPSIISTRETNIVTQCHRDPALINKRTNHQSTKKPSRSSIRRAQVPSRVRCSATSSELSDRTPHRRRWRTS